MWGPSLCLSADVWICGWLLFVILDVVCIVAIAEIVGLDLFLCVWERDSQIAGVSSGAITPSLHQEVCIVNSIHLQDSYWRPSDWPWRYLFSWVLSAKLMQLPLPILWRVSIHTRQLMSFFQLSIYVAWTPILGSCPRSKAHICTPGCLRMKLNSDRSPLSLLMLSQVWSQFMKSFGQPKNSRRWTWM